MNFTKPVSLAAEARELASREGISIAEAQLRVERRRADAHLPRARVTSADRARALATERGIPLRDAQLAIEREVQATRAISQATEPQATPAKSLATLARDLKAKHGISLETAQVLAQKQLREGRAEQIGPGRPVARDRFTF